jgi:eukaryotic-like serine/threonine-protein kinase
MNSYVIISPGMLQIGDQFDRFQIQAHLAQGGMSDIYRAFDMVNHCEVAIKVPDPSIIGDPAQYERFQRELQVMKTLQHPAILHGIDSGKYNRTPFLVTEFVQGQMLRQLIETGAPMTPDQAIPIVRKIADGMAYCHENGVIHRDLKPENILITADRQPIIMDFGLVLTKGARRVTYSNLSATMGTPDYMAPEQVEGKRGDARTDIYALGTILYEMLAGKTPFSGDNNLAVMAMHLRGNVPRLDRERSGISQQIAAIVAKCLQRDPEARYQNMRALIDALDHPETVDLAVLEQASILPLAPFWKSSFFPAVGISILVMLAIVALALALQSIRP